MLQISNIKYLHFEDQRIKCKLTLKCNIFLQNSAPTQDSEPAACKEETPPSPLQKQVSPSARSAACQSGIASAVYAPDAAIPSNRLACKTIAESADNPSTAASADISPAAASADHQITAASADISPAAASAVPCHDRPPCTETSFEEVAEFCTYIR
jgi:hypothetical protein